MTRFNSVVLIFHQASVPAGMLVKTRFLGPFFRVSDFVLDVGAGLENLQV